MRLYLPSTAVLLRAALHAGEFAARPLTAFAVTPALRETYLGELEELEYLAQLAAARASLRLLDADPTAPRRRLVVAMEVPAGSVVVRDDLEVGAVQLLDPVPWRCVQAALVDGAEAEPAVAVAAAAVLAADLGGEEAQFAVDETEGHELGWWARQELELLADGLG